MWRIASSLPSLLLAGWIGLLLGVVACSSSEEGAAPDVDGGEDVQADVVEDSAPDDIGDEDIAEDVRGDVTPQRCVPGQTRCAGTRLLETCSESERWEEATCPEGRCLRSCVEELDREGQPAASCSAARCGVASSCAAGSVARCVGCTAYEGCHPSGEGEGIWPVPEGQACVEDEGGNPRLVQTLCTAGTTRCQPGNDVIVELCASCGLEWVEARDCDRERTSNVCDEGDCITQCQFIEKRETYVGCEYWGVELDQAFVPSGGGFIDGSAAPFAIVVSNVHDRVDAEVEVLTRTGVVQRATIPPRSLHVFQLNEHIVRGTMRGFYAYQVRSSMPIVAYQFNPLNNEEVYSNDASLLYPTSALGTQYYVMTRRQTFDVLKGYLTVVAVLEGETEVTVRLPPASAENPLVTLGGQGIPVMRGGDTFRATLQQFEVLNIETNRPGADLTGAYVSASRQVAVFGGSQAANVPNDDSCIFRQAGGSFQGGWVCEADRTRPCVNGAGEPDIRLCSSFVTCCADHLEQMMVPINRLGRRILAARSQPRGDEPDYWRIMAVENDTEVTLIGLPDVWPLPRLIPNPANRQRRLNAGEWFEVPSPVDFEIVGTKPLLVGQFLAAEFAPYPRGAPTGPNSPVPYPDPGTYREAGTGDPAFVIATPAEQFLREYVFLMPDGYAQEHVTITAPVGTEVTLNGERIPPGAFTPFGRGDFAAHRRQLFPGVHRLEASAPVGVMVHGYDSFVSYAYPAGMSFSARSRPGE